LKKAFLWHQFSAICIPRKKSSKKDCSVEGRQWDQRKYLSNANSLPLPQSSPNNREQKTIKIKKKKIL
jgi:hypothetical protein